MSFFDKFLFKKFANFEKANKTYKAAVLLCCTKTVSDMPTNFSFSSQKWLLARVKMVILGQKWLPPT